MIALWWPKIVAWVKKYWIFILVVPAVLIGLSYLAKFITRLTRKPPAPDLVADQQAEASQVQQIQDAGAAQIEQIKKDADAKKNGIDHGNPKPADVFNEVLKK